MIARTLAHYHLPILSCVGLLLFVAVFVGALIWVNRRGAKRIYETFGALPLQDLEAFESSKETSHV